MVPIPVPLPAWRSRRHSNRLSVVIWATPYVFLIPAMVAVGLLLLIAPKRTASWERYGRGLAALLETSLTQAVAYRAGAPSQRTDRGRARARTRPAASTRPGGKPGAARSPQRPRHRR